MKALLRHAASSMQLLTLSVLAVCGCSDGGPGGGGAASSSLDLATVSACYLLAPAEIEAATGVAVAVGQDRSELDGRLPMCFWPRAGSELDYVVNVLVTMSSYSSYEQYMRLSGGDAESGEHPDLGTVRHVDGVGRFGAWLEDLGMLQVYGDIAMVQVTVQVADERSRMEAAQTLAATALGRLQ